MYTSPLHIVNKVTLLSLGGEGGGGSKNEFAEEMCQEEQISVIQQLTNAILGY